MILALGFLSVLLLMMLMLAMASDTERKAARVNADRIRTRMLAESALEQAVGRLEQEFPRNLYPGDRFFVSSPDSGWYGRNVLFSASEDDAGIRDALAFTEFGVRVTPEEELSEDAGWIPVVSDGYDTGEEDPGNRPMFIGRYAYVILDESGKIDPATAVSARVPESVPATQHGADPSELSLAELGFRDPDRFRPAEVSDGTPGTLPGDERWLSMGHMARTVGMDDEEIALALRTLVTDSRDSEIFWRDGNANGTWDEGEDEERLDLAAAPSAEAVYRLLAGEDTASGDDDVLWLKRLDATPEFRNLVRAGLPVTEARRRAAAQVAVNLADYGDADEDPTVMHLNDAGDLVPGMSPGAVHVRGTERRWGISAVSLRVDVEKECSPYRDLLGPVCINPNNSDPLHLEFQIKTLAPDGSAGPTYDRDNLQASSPCVFFEGNVSYLQLKPKRYDNTITIDGAPIVLRNNELYTFAPVPGGLLRVRVFNTREGSGGKATGDWYLAIEEARDVVISPEPLSSGYRYRPTVALRAAHPYELKGDSGVPFDISDTAIVPREDCRPIITVLGCDLRHTTGNYDLPVTLSLLHGRSSTEPWGDASSPVEGNVNDTRNPREAIAVETPAGASIGILARSFVKRKNGLTGKPESHWQQAIAVNSATGSPLAKALRNGDTFPCDRVPYTLAPYVKDGVVTLAEHQAVLLFELGTTTASLADYLDLAVLVALVRPDRPEAADGEALLPGAYFEVDLTLDLETASGLVRSRDFAFSAPADSGRITDRGGVILTAEPAEAPWNHLPATRRELYRIRAATIRSLRLNTRNDLDPEPRVVDRCPLDETRDRLWSWESPWSREEDGEYTVALEARDPLLTTRVKDDADAELYWRPYPDADTITAGTGYFDPTDLTELYESAAYCDAEPGGRPMVRVGEIGRTHSWLPMRSLRLWSASRSEEASHDGAITDLFKIGNATEVRGRVNPNTHRPEVLRALFAGIAGLHPEVAAQTVLERRTEGALFGTRGDLLGGCGGLMSFGAGADDEAEKAAEALLEKLSVRQTYFTIVACAQALKDIEGLTYRSGTRTQTASLCRLDVVRGSDGEVGRYIDRILARQKLLAFVRRDAISNKVEVERVRYLLE